MACCQEVSDKKKELNEYYGSRGISYENFHCPFESRCRGVTEEAGLKFSIGRGAYVDTKYSDTRPKILFISLDPGEEEHDKPSVPKKLSEYNRNLRRRHWFQTHDFALEMLRGLQPDIKYDIDTVCDYLSHANAVKCTQNKKNNAVADSVLFENCKEHLIGEVKVLDPDIIITQGNQAFYSFDYAVKKSFPRLRWIDVSGRMPAVSENQISIIEINSKEVLWLHTYHPGAGKPYGRYWKEQRSSAELLEIIREWWNHRILT